jgi:Na+/glutamate symporter
MFRRLFTATVLYSVPTLAFAQAEPVDNLGRSFLLTLILLFIAGVVAVAWLLVGLLGKVPSPFPPARELLEPNLAWAFVGAVIVSRVWSGWQFHNALDFAAAVAGGVVLLELGRLLGQVRFTGVPDWRTR